MREQRESGSRETSQLDQLRRVGVRAEQPADQREVDLYVRTYTTLLPAKSVPGPRAEDSEPISYTRANVVAWAGE